MNFATNQEKWNKGEISLEGCFRKGQEHRAYGWAKIGLGFPPTQLQRTAYEAGYYGRNVKIVSS